MFDYFHGWKRKVGLVTLAIASLFATGWVASLTAQFCLEYYYPGVVGGVGSTNGQFMYATISPQWDRPLNVQWSVEPISGPPDPWVGYQIESRWHWRQFEWGIANVASEPSIKLRLLSIPYWSIVIPLTGVSAWLLFPKRRQPIKTQLSPVPAT